MKNILVFLTQNDSQITKQSLSTITAAWEIKKVLGLDEVIGVILGDNSESTSRTAGNFGINKCYYSQDVRFNKFIAKEYALVCQSIALDNNCSLIVAPASSMGKDFMPMIAAEFEAGQASDIVGINQDGSFKRPIFAGNLFADVEITSEKKVITVRSSAFPPAAANSVNCEVLQYQIKDTVLNKVEVISYEISANERPELGDASVVVSGGRALQSAENFEKIIFPLADSLKAAVGASRAAVDSGYAPNDWQVGQTGKVVAPNLYIAVGISGAIQHLAGMKDSKVIVAINKDPEAPIFEIADYGIVGDLFEIAPQLTNEINKAKNN